MITAKEASALVPSDETFVELELNRIEADIKLAASRAIRYIFTYIESNSVKIAVSRRLEELGYMVVYGESQYPCRITVHF